MNEPDAPVGVTVSTTGPIAHLCPYRDEVDEGEVTITWDTNGSTIELHDLRAYLDAWETVKISHEALTARIAEELTGVEVVTKFYTAGMTVVCRKGGSHQVLRESVRVEGGAGNA